MTTLKKVDIFSGIGLGVLSVLVWVGSIQFAGRDNSTYGPEFFPRFLAVCMFVSALLLIARAVRGLSLRPVDVIQHAGFMRAAISLGICIVYIVAMQLIGFLVATIGFLFALMSFIGQKGLRLRILVSIAVAIGVMLLFQNFLKIPLPEMDFSFRY